MGKAINSWAQCYQIILFRHMNTDLRQYWFYGGDEVPHIYNKFNILSIVFQTSPYNSPTKWLKNRFTALCFSGSLLDKKVSKLNLISSLPYIKLSQLYIKVSSGPNKKVSYLNRKFSFLRSNGGQVKKSKNWLLIISNECQWGKFGF